MSSKNFSKMASLNTDSFKVIMLALLAVSAFAACTKSVPYDQVFKEDIHEKSAINADAEYLYVASSDSSSADISGASEARPYWQGDAELVKFRFTETSLQAVQVVKDSRLKNNSLNEKIILEIPIQHLDYRCSEDRYGKCTNKEEANEEVNWTLKKKFKPDFNSLKTVAKTIIPVEMEKVFGNSCYTEVASVLRKYEITDDAINIQLTKTYDADLKCLSKQGVGVSDLMDLQSQLVQHFSFTKLDKLASADYEIVNYPKPDESEFGFFTTEDNKLDVDFAATQSGEKQYMARWNPNKKEIVFYLSDNFNKPQYAAVKEATKVAFERFNAGLKMAKANTTLVLKEANQKDPGDARNSMIVLVEDPVSSGPLGYGPSVKNPRTGEILSARTVMYYGSFLTTIRSTYDEIVEELRERSNAEKNAPKPTGSAQNVSEALKVQKTLNGRIKENVSKKIISNYTDKKLQSFSKAQSLNSGTHSVTSSRLNVNLDRKSLQKSLLVSDKSMDEENIMSAMSKHCNYPSEYVDFDVAIKNALRDKLGANLKPWIDLSESERQSLVDIVAPTVWIPTLVHELGHNFGLSHNFGGSEDKDNFYNKQELAAMGVNHEIPYSSVMDYGYSELNLLPTLGKYDIAALRFAFNREVELKDGTFLKVKTTLKDLKNEKVELKNYSYCSDEHVEVNPNCKRFDKGTNFTEIAQFLAGQHDRMYKRRNLRNDRQSFSMGSDRGYALGRRQNFAYLRAFLERYESIKSRFQISDDADEWKSGFLKDVKDAAIVSGKFFLDVMTTPDVTCAIAKADDLTKIVQFPRLEIFGEQYLNCFDVTLKPEFKMVGQTGKFFTHKKDPNSENYYQDQIDIRGFYTDKILAAEALFKRKIGNYSYDKGEDNYLDIPELSEQITDTVNQLIFGTLTKKVSFKDQSGSEVLQVEIPVHVATPPTTGGKLTHWIPSLYNKDAASLLRLPEHQVSFQQVLLNVIDSSMKESQVRWQEDQAFANAYRAVKTNTSFQFEKRAGTTVSDIGNLRVIAQSENPAAAEISNIYNMTVLLSKLSADDMAKFKTERMAAATKMSPVKNTSFGANYDAIPMNIVSAYEQGAFSKDLLEYLATILPASNF